MAYEGEELTFCPGNMFDFRNAAAVIVSGDGINHWGHMLLNTGGSAGNYFQIAGVRVRPRYMDEGGYQRYLQETGKHEIRRIAVRIPHPEASQLKVEQLLNDSWTWGIVVHNCETLVEDIIVAGGGPKVHHGLVSLPTWADQDEDGAGVWTCKSLQCPSHARRKDVCKTGVWLCGRKEPACPGHARPGDVCSGGIYWSCGALSCPTHSHKNHCCQKGVGVWKCNLIDPPCPSHSSPSDHC